MASINPITNSNGSSDTGGIGLTLSGVSTPAPAITNSPKQLFDISVLSNLRDSDKYLGENRVSEIKESYQTYLTGTPIGRGGQYAVDSARKYGTSIADAAKGYLERAGLPKLADILPVAVTNTNTSTNTNTEKETIEKKTDTNEKNPIELLIDAFTRSFGNAVYNPPLQSQSSGFTGLEQGVPLAESGGGNIGTYIILGVVGVIAYFLYKRFAS